MFQYGMKVLMENYLGHVSRGGDYWLIPKAEAEDILHRCNQHIGLYLQKNIYVEDKTPTLKKPVTPKKGEVIDVE